MNKLKRKNFFRVRDIFIFLIFFIVLLYMLFPKHIIHDFIDSTNTGNNRLQVQYLTSLLKTKKSLKLKMELIRKYAQDKEYTRAFNLLKTLKVNYKVLALKFSILSQEYFQTQDKNVLQQANQTLSKLLNYAKTQKEYEYIYKEAKSLNFINLKLRTLYILTKFDKNYLIQLVDDLMWLHKDPLVFTIMNENYQKKLPQKVYIKFLNIAMNKGYKSLVKSLLLKINPKKYTMQIAKGYLYLGNINKAYEVVKKYRPDNIYKLAQLSLWTKRFQKALKYYQKLNKKHFSYKRQQIIYRIAIALDRYDILEKILIQEVKRGEFNKVKDLEFIFMQNFHLYKAIKFFDKMYQKHRLDKFLFSEFYFYYVLGDVKGMKKIANQLGRDITPYVAMQVSNIYLGEKNPQKAYRLLVLALRNDKHHYYVFYKTLYAFAMITGHKKEAMKILAKAVKVKGDPFDVVALADNYENTNPQKAFNLLMKYYKKDKSNVYYFFKLVNVAYKLKKWRFIIQLSKTAKKTSILDKPFFWDTYATAYSKIGEYKIGKQIYEKSFPYVMDRTQFYWFLVNHNDQDIGKYLPKIHNPKLLVAAYDVLHLYKKEKILLQKMISQDPNNYELLVKYYNVLGNLGEAHSELQFKLYKLCKQKIVKNKNILKNENFFQLYFGLSLQYDNYSNNKKLLDFAKKHFKNYINYEIDFYSYYNDYNKLKQLERHYD